MTFYKIFWWVVCLGVLVWGAGAAISEVILKTSAA